MLLPLILMTLISFSALSSAREKPQTLVTVENYPITDFDINQVIVSSPMADSFPTMDEKDQAGLRGDILIRLINMNLLYQEAQAMGLDKDAEYLKDRESYKKGYIFRSYMNKIRSSIEVPKKVMDEMVSRLRGNIQALDAAISQYKSQQYKLLKTIAFQNIRDQLHLKLFTSRIQPGITDDTVLAVADGYSLSYGDLHFPAKTGADFIKDEIEEALYKKLEIDLVSKVAESSTENLDRVLQTFQRERLPALLMTKKEEEWIPSTESAREYFQQHKNIGYEPEQRYISQIVFNNENQARIILDKIRNGASFHRMAQKFSIDPVGRKNAGQVGWVPENSGQPEIEQALKTLKDNEVSDVIKTSLGYHLILVEGRKLGKQRTYDEIYDQVKQAIIQSKLPGYIKTLQHKYKIEFTEPVAQTYIDASGQK
jgi:parvulin-like peptidyl-prolyl isomerase